MLCSCQSLIFTQERRCLYLYSSSMSIPSSISPIIHSLPSSCLVNAFGNEVCWESVLKLLPVFKRVVDLGVRHAAALKPAIKHLRDPPQHALTAPWRDGQIVDAVQRKYGQGEGKKEKSCTIVKTNGSNNNFDQLLKLCFILRMFWNLGKHSADPQVDMFFACGPKQWFHNLLPLWTRFKKRSCCADTHKNKVGYCFMLQGYGLIHSIYRLTQIQPVKKAIVSSLKLLELTANRWKQNRRFSHIVVREYQSI